MAYYEKEVLSVEEEKGTAGGSTFWVEHPDWEGEEVALCWRKVKNNDAPGGRCGNEAGFRTWHVGTGACYFHGGLAGRYANKDGKLAHTTRLHLKKQIDDYIESGDRRGMFDLTYELAAMRVLFQNTLEEFPEPGDRKFGSSVQRAVQMVQATGSLVDKISKIESRNTITAAQVIYLRIAIAELLVKYIPDLNRRERALKELMAMIPGGENDTETDIVVMR